MHPVLRIWLFLASAWLSWLLYRKRAPSVLWVYFALAAYSTASFKPSQVDWWLHTWLWMEPVRMIIRTAISVHVFSSVRGDRPAIARISLLVASAFVLMYRLSFGPTGLSQFMVIRTYWLLFLWISLITAILCLWVVSVRIPERLSFWTICIFCYAASAVIDWRITTSSGWEENTNFWSLALNLSLCSWSLIEYLE